MSVTVIVRVTSAQGAHDQLRDALAKALPDTRVFAGCEGVEVVQPRDEANALVLIEKWASLDHFEAYKKWRVESGTTVLGSSLVEGPPTTWICDPVSA